MTTPGKYDTSAALRLLASALHPETLVDERQDAGMALLRSLVSLDRQLPGVRAAFDATNTVSIGVGVETAKLLCSHGNVFLVTREGPKKIPLEYDPVQRLFVGPEVECAPAGANGERPRRGALELVVEAVLNEVKRERGW